MARAVMVNVCMFCDKPNCNCTWVDTSCWHCGSLIGYCSIRYFFGEGAACRRGTNA